MSAPIRGLVIIWWLLVLDIYEAFVVHPKHVVRFLFDVLLLPLAVFMWVASPKNIQTDVLKKVLLTHESLNNYSPVIFRHNFGRLLLDDPEERSRFIQEEARVRFMKDIGQ